MGVQLFEQKNFTEPSYLEKKVKVTWAIQKVGQTVIIPSMWTHWVIRVVMHPIILF